MKKILLYISAFLLLIIILVKIQAILATTYAAEPDSSDNGHTKVVIEELVEEAKKDKRKIVAKDMYLKIYKSTNIDPEDKAMKTVAKKFGLTESQAVGMIKGGDLSTLIKRQQFQSLETIQAQYATIYNKFQAELDKENIKSELEAAVTPSEIFSDGDTSNSEFDLIYDLNIIEIILFNETTANAFGGDFDFPDFDYTDEEEEEAIKELFEEPEEEIEEIEEVEEEEEIVEAEEREGINPLTCFEEDEALQDSMSTFEEEEEEEEEKKAEEKAADIEDLDEEDKDEKEEEEEEEFPSADPGDWPKKFLCPDEAFFCIELEFDIAEAKLYQKSDNCIACHVQKINEALDKVLQKPLSANKLSGNMFEVPKCKSSFKNLPVNMKIITVAVPPPQPQNQDIFFQADIAKEWQKFNERYKPFWYKKTEKAEKEDETKPTPTVENRAVRRAIRSAGPDPTQENVHARTEKAITAKQNETNKDVRIKRQETTAENQNTYYQVIIKELATMNTYFERMKETFEKIKDPCNKTATKGNCT